jgi:NAD(P)-dependent dehydrogenase (short-subunit alcohol dehydrogenase family)
MQLASGAWHKLLHSSLQYAHMCECTAGAAPLRRIGRDDDMAGIAIFLASRAGSYLNGAVIPVDGGIATTASGTAG